MLEQSKNFKHLHFLLDHQLIVSAFCRIHVCLLCVYMTYAYVKYFVKLLAAFPVGCALTALKAMSIRVQ